MQDLQKTNIPATKDADANPKKPQARERLAFDTDRGASRSTWLALVFLLAIVGWMGSGFVIPSEEIEEEVVKEEVALVSVAIAKSTAEPVTLFYQAEGQALPDRDTMLRAETSGDIVEVFVGKGENVTAGTAIAQFDTTTSDADIKRATEDLIQAQRELQIAEQLFSRNAGTESRLLQARSSLSSILSQLTSAEKAADALVIKAPFAGRIETLDLDQGEFVSLGTNVGRLVDITPLTIAFQVPQQSLTLLKVGQDAQVKFITGEEREGTLTFVGTSAAAETRTFLAEVEVKNADGAIPAGISAEVSIPTGNATAHFVSPSIVSLSTEGQVGVKTVGENDVVEFYPVQVIKAQIDGIWVTGLPDNINMITVGQGFVNVGETVAPRAEEMNQ